MTWKVNFDPAAIKELRKLDPPIAKRILKYLYGHIAKLENPRSVGKALKGNLDNLWRYDIGAWRIIVSIEDDKLTILCVRIGHRREVYK
ncbi:MAG: type II toxin-antitoxin system RelE/ParE family toxin [Syntrophorhabdaceae bacterium]|nr:type II toxin-antitoxin system RelE/ParE family toxin [Syntrophorhabdaceae bacterium]